MNVGMSNSMLLLLRIDTSAMYCLAFSIVSHSRPVIAIKLIFWD